MSEIKIHRIWKHISLSNEWKSCDTSIIDNISQSWFERRGTLENDSAEYADFILRLKREHAIETGIVERMYDLDRGITETFIQKGFIESFISHNDTNVPVPKLLKHLKDHLEAVDFVFDVVKNNRPLTTGFIKELHALVTRNQDSAEGRDQFGNKIQIPLIKGKYKERENNPTREDGTVIYYCPPEHVSAEMDTLINFYNQAEADGLHPAILAAWLHHAVTTIHPFQDGNGRVVRLITSLVLIKNGLFPFTVLREETKEKYIETLELADQEQPQPFVDYLMEVQKRSIEKALNLKSVNSNSLEDVANVFSAKLEQRNKEISAQRENKLAENRKNIFDTCYNTLIRVQQQLKLKLNGNATLKIDSCSFGGSQQYYYYGQIIKYAIQHNYYFNRTLPKSWLTFNIGLKNDITYRLGISIHHHGYDDATMAIGVYLEYLENEKASANTDERVESSLPLDIKPLVLSIADAITENKKNEINVFVEHAITLMLAHIASEI